MTMTIKQDYKLMPRTRPVFWRYAVQMMMAALTMGAMMLALLWLATM